MVQQLLVDPISHFIDQLNYANKLNNNSNMGNSETNSTPVGMLKHFEKRFIISAHPLDPDENLMFYMHERLSNDKYILRVVSTNDHEEKQKMEQLICKKLATNGRSNEGSNLMLVPIDHYLFEEDKGYCNSISKCYMLFNPKNSQPLTYHLARGHYNHDLRKSISEDTVYRGLLNLIEAVALLKFYNHPHRHINCDTVYFSREGNTFVLADPWISPLTDFHEQYHAPEKLKQMRNELEKHDPFLADLFSVGMVGLKMLGNNNLTEYYSMHKTINQAGLTQLASTIRHDKLRSLILKLLSQNVETRSEVLNHSRLDADLKQEMGTSKLTKTRNLSGKMASVRKSFLSESRPIAKFGSRLPQVQQVVAGNLGKEGALHMAMTEQNPFVKKKLEPVPTKNQPYSGVPALKNRSDEKPEIDMSMPLTAANLMFNTLTPTGYGQAFQSSQPTSTILITPKTGPYQMGGNLYEPAHRTYMVAQNSSGFTLNMHKPTSNPILMSSGSERLLKNVSSTPVSFMSSQFHNEMRNKFPMTYSQKGLSLKVAYDRSSDMKDQFLTLNNKTSATVDDHITKKQDIICFSELKRNQKFNVVSPVTNPSISSPISIRKETVKSEKDEGNPVRTNSSYPSSESFESDHFYQRKIYQNLKNLENKVSEAINSSRLNAEESRASSSFAGPNLDNSGKMIESVIVVKEQDASSQSTVRAINDQLKVEDQIFLDKNNSEANPAQNGVAIKQEEKLSPILVREQSESVHEISKRSEESELCEHSQTNQESVDFLNVNTCRGSPPPEKQKQSQGNNFESEQKFQDIKTPAKASSVLRLEGNNLTIPEESDEQSIEGEVSRYKGEYVQEMYQNGGKYLGYMLNGQRNGNGVFYYKDGGYYDGRWKQNMMNGYGKLYYETGKLAYEGQWYQDEFHGRGTVYNDQPEMVPEEGFDYKNMNESENYWQYYEGDLSHDMKARYGKLMLSNGEYYEGEFKNDQVNGKGQFHRHDGSVVKGMWSEGFFIREI